MIPLGTPVTVFDSDNRIITQANIKARKRLANGSESYQIRHPVYSDDWFGSEQVQTNEHAPMQANHTGYTPPHFEEF